MKAIILAAGRGSRMQEQTADKPKCLVNLWDHTLLEMNIRALELAGLSRQDIGIITGYQAEKIQIEGLKYWHNPRWEETNMFYTLTMAKEWLATETCLVCYSDIVYHPHAIQRLLDCPYDLAITYYTHFQTLWELRFDDPLDDVESFQIDSQGRLLAIGERVQRMQDVQGQFMGLLRFSPKGWQTIWEATKQPMPKSLDKIDMTTLLGHLLRQNQPIYGIPCAELWLECDNTHDLALYEQHFSPTAFPQTQS